MLFCYSYSQVGIGTDTPDVATILHLESSSKGLLIPKLSESQRDNISSPPDGLLIYQTNNIVGFYSYTSENGWSRMSMSSEINSIGDVKTGMQSADHNGWVKLDGRAKSSLITSQQTAATNLGIGDNLPDANNAYLVQNGGTLGGVTGANAKTISRENLPNVDLTTTQSGDHQHVLPFAGNYPATNTIFKFVFGASDLTAGDTDQGIESYNEGSNRGSEGDERHYLNKEAGNHTHTFNLNGNLSQTNLDITPKSLSINTFIYLGN